MNVEKYKQIATDCASLLAEGYTHANGRVEAYEPAEFQMGLTLALAMYLKAMFPGELRRSTPPLPEPAADAGGAGQQVPQGRHARHHRGHSVDTVGATM